MMQLPGPLHISSAQVSGGSPVEVPVSVGSPVVGVRVSVTSVSVPVPEDVGVESETLADSVPVRTGLFPSPFVMHPAPRIANAAKPCPYFISAQTLGYPPIRSKMKPSRVAWPRWEVLPWPRTDTV